MSYLEDFKKIQAFSSEFWDRNNIYKTNIDWQKEKMVILDFFPYPSGVGLHVGHTLGYIATDIYARFYRLNGKNVLHAMGYDAFGLPAEQFAIENNEHPSISTYKNIANIKSQLKLLGLGHDNDRTFNTTDPDYYKWTQWIFLKLYNSYFNEEEQKAKPIEELIDKLKVQGKSDQEINEIVKENRLAYLDLIHVNWCPKLGTVLSNEEVIGGVSERGSYPVYKKPLKQWVLKITKYTKRLLNNLEYLDWPENVKEMQINWIGQSSGYLVTFPTEVGDVIVYTTKLHTLIGVTFIALSKNHPDIYNFFSKEQVEKCLNNERFEGIQSKIQARHPLTDEYLPIFIADYVLSYGTSAVMGVPAHDERDNVFANHQKLPKIFVGYPNNQYLTENHISMNEYIENIVYRKLQFDDEYYHLNDFAVDDLMFNDEYFKESKIIPVNYLEIEERFNKYSCVKKAMYSKLKDWVFSRQRYWGEPFPIILDEQGNPYALEDEALPVELPDITDFKSLSKNSDDICKPLDNCVSWKNVNFIKLKNGKVRVITNELEANGEDIYKGRRETNTMPNWAGSCWYYFRYFDAKNKNEFIGQEAMRYWGTPKKTGCVDLYLGGAEHAVLHLLYARFWHMVLYDLGYVQSKEPFQKLFNQGMILGPSYKNANGKYFDYKDVVKQDNKFFSRTTNEELYESMGKIGKRYKNGVTPEEVCGEYSIDALRLFMMYLGPLEQNKPWDYSAIKGMVRLLQKVYNLKPSNIKDSNEILNAFNIALEDMTKYIKDLKFNIAIAQFIILINKIKSEPISYDLYKKILIIFSPFAPYLSEYLYQLNFESNTIFQANWPMPYKIDYKVEFMDLIISLNGKKNGRLQVPFNSSEEDLYKYVQNYCTEKKIKYEEIIIPEKRRVFFANIVS